MASKDVAEATPTSVAPVPPAVAAMILDLKQRATEGNAESDPNVIRMDILERILTADTLEEATQGSTDVMGLLQVPLSIDVRAWQPSVKAELGVFAVLDCVDDAGKKYVVTCGSTNVVAILYRAGNENRLPLRAMFRANETRSDNMVYWLDILAD